MKYTLNSYSPNNLIYTASCLLKIFELFLKSFPTIFKELLEHLKTYTVKEVSVTLGEITCSLNMSTNPVVFWAATVKCCLCTDKGHVYEHM